MMWIDKTVNGKYAVVGAPNGSILELDVTPNDKYTVSKYHHKSLV